MRTRSTHVEPQERMTTVEALCVVLPHSSAALMISFKYCCAFVPEFVRIFRVFPFGRRISDFVLNLECHIRSCLFRAQFRQPVVTDLIFFLSKENCRKGFEPLSISVSAFSTKIFSGSRPIDLVIALRFSILSTSVFGFVESLSLRVCF